MQLGALSGGRVSLSNNATSLALTALTIGIRYACTRKQFGPPGH
jgi:alkylation response protein AidB-like acyl-CoA dehydrogenase